MAANVETMMYVREVPWHGLGKNLEYAPTSEEAIIAAGLDWRVDSRPVYDAQGSEIHGYKANFRDIDNKCLGIVSNRYTIVQNAEAFEFTDSLISEGMKYETAGSLRGGKQIWLLGKMPEPKKILDDDVDPYICFTNTHDGTGSIRVCMTPVRVVCNNTLNFALSTAKRTWAARHIGDIASKLEEARNTLDLANVYMDQLTNTCEILADQKVSDAEIEHMLELAFPIDEEKDTLRKLQRVEETKSAIFKCLSADDIKQYQGTMYALMMAITDYADHNPPARLTANYNENRWGQIIVGHPLVDQFYKMAAAA